MIEEDFGVFTPEFWKLLSLRSSKEITYFYGDGGLAFDRSEGFGWWYSPGYWRPQQLLLTGYLEKRRIVPPQSWQERFKNFLAKKSAKQKPVQEVSQSLFDALPAKEVGSPWVTLALTAKGKGYLKYVESMSPVELADKIVDPLSWGCGLVFTAIDWRWWGPFLINCSCWSCLNRPHETKDLSSHHIDYKRSLAGLIGLGLIYRYESRWERFDDPHNHHVKLTDKGWELLQSLVDKNPEEFMRYMTEHWNKPGVYGFTGDVASTFYRLLRKKIAYSEWPGILCKLDGGGATELAKQLRKDRSVER